MERFYVETHTLWLPNEIMDKEEITFVLLSYCWVEIENRVHERKHRHSIADAPQRNSETSAMDHPNHPRKYHIKYTSPTFTREC